MRNLMTIFTLALVACGYSEEKYAEDLAAKLCDTLVECGGECVEGTGTGTGTVEIPDTCEFDSKAAKECIDATWECTDVGGVQFPTPAAVCATVYVCEGTGETTTPRGQVG